jgi:glycosyltransferase involved in cell wall biosynthesis
VVSSVNSTESFGLVQVEAMLCGCPVVASDLPGVRQPVQLTGMGIVVPPADPGAIATAIGEVLAHRDRFVRSRHEIQRQFDIAATGDGYERLFAEVAGDV